MRKFSFHGKKKVSVSKPLGRRPGRRNEVASGAVGHDSLIPQHKRLAGA